MHKLMLIDAQHPEEMRMVITDHKSTIHEFDFTTAAKQQIKGNIYLAKVTRVEPSLQAAFVEYGGGKQGFLPFAEIHPDYYQIPMADRIRLLEEAMAEDDADSEESAAASGDRGDRRDRRDRRRRRGRGKDRDRRRDQEPRGEETSDASQAVTSQSDEAIQDEHFDAAEASAFEVDATITESAEGYALTLTEINSQTVSENAETPHSDAADRISESVGIPLPEAVISEKTEEELQSISANDDAEDISAPESASDEDNRNTDPQDTEVETLSSEDEIERPRRTHFSRRYKIQEVIKRGQIMLVQVIKEERGNKGVSLTSYLSLAGRYCVLMPNSPRGGGVSRKIGTGDDRRRLKGILDDLELPRGMSVIIRTAGASRTKVEVKRDFDYLVKLWNQIREDTLSSTAPALIYKESDLIKRSIRDVYSNEIEEILVEGEAAYKDARHFMKMLVPSHAPRVKLFKGNVPLFTHYHVEEPLLSMHDPVVKLRSGGYIVMNPTEALISIDVNSGRSTGERNIEETAVKTNIEAAQEIARQLRLRDLAGLIVIDFIDMMDGKNRRNVERVLKDALRNDRAKIQIGRISPFGLLEMSRQRLRPSIAESVTKPCDHCNGTGIVKSDAAVAMQLVRTIEKDAGQQPTIERFKIFLTPSVAVYLLNHMRDTLHKLEQEYDIGLEVQIDAALREGTFRIDKVRSKDKDRVRQKDVRKPVTMEATEEDLSELEAFEAEIAAEEAENLAAEESVEKPENNGKPSRRRDRNRRRRGRDQDNNKEDSTDNSENPADQDSDNEKADVTAQEVTPEKKDRRRVREQDRDHHRSRPDKKDKTVRTKTSDAAIKEAPVVIPASHPAKEFPHIARSPVPASVLPAASPSAHSITETTSELAVLAEPKAKKPTRKGWWQKIME